MENGMQFFLFLGITRGILGANKETLQHLSHLPPSTCKISDKRSVWSDILSKEPKYLTK